MAKLRDYRIKADRQTIAKALQGHWREERLFEIAQAVEAYDTYQEKMAECDRRIESHLNAFEDRNDGGPVARDPKKKNRQHNAPDLDLQTHIYRMTGVDPSKIDGIDGYTALKVISEIGPDMTRWPAVKHVTTWLGLCPGSEIPAGGVKSSCGKPSANRAAAALRLAANSLHRSNSGGPSFAVRRPRLELPRPSQPPPTSWLVSYTRCSSMGRNMWTMVKNITKANIGSVH